MTDHNEPRPSRAEIRRMCREIQAKWSPTVERSRRGVRGETPYEVPRVAPLACAGRYRLPDLKLMENPTP